jgi:hypothetical protein
LLIPSNTDADADADADVAEKRDASIPPLIHDQPPATMINIGFGVGNGGDGIGKESNKEDSFKMNGLQREYSTLFFSKIVRHQIILKM